MFSQEFKTVARSCPVRVYSRPSCLDSFYNGGVLSDSSDIPLNNNDERRGRSTSSRGIGWLSEGIERFVCAFSSST